MARPARALPKSPRHGAARSAIAIVTFIAFALQSLVLQMHIHGAAPAATPPLAIEKVAGHQPDGAPPGNDPANCPICQELLHAGAFVTPTTVLLQVATVATVVTLLVAETIATADRPAHGWNSRAPPLA